MIEKYIQGEVSDLIYLKLKMCSWKLSFTDERRSGICNINRVRLATAINLLFL